MYNEKKQKIIPKKYIYEELIKMRKKCGNTKMAIRSFLIKNSFKYLSHHRRDYNAFLARISQLFCTKFYLETYHLGIVHN